MRIKIKTVWKAENKDGAVKQGRLRGRAADAAPDFAAASERSRCGQSHIAIPIAAARGFPGGTGQLLPVALLALMGWTLRAGDGGSLRNHHRSQWRRGSRRQITATETATAVKQTITTDGQGFYSFQSLPVGRYNVEVDASGFKPLRRTGVGDRCRTARSWWTRLWPSEREPTQ